jgi:hypothetical protein
MTTQATWITRQRTTVRDIRGVLGTLEEAGVIDFAQVTIMAVDDERAVMLASGQVLTVDNLPPEGILMLPDEADA